MYLYKIYTEDKNEERIHHLAQSRRLEDYTILKGTGFFKDQKEQSLIIEVIGLAHLIERFVFSLAKDIKLINKQESVYITVQRIELHTI